MSKNGKDDPYSHIRRRIPPTGGPMKTKKYDDGIILDEEDLNDLDLDLEDLPRIK